MRCIMLQYGSLKMQPRSTSTLTDSSSPSTLQGPGDRKDMRGNRVRSAPLMLLCAASLVACFGCAGEGADSNLSPEEANTAEVNQASQITWTFYPVSARLCYPNPQTCTDYPNYWEAAQWVATEGMPHFIAETCDSSFYCDPGVAADMDFMFANLEGEDWWQYNPDPSWISNTWDGDAWASEGQPDHSTGGLPYFRCKQTSVVNWECWTGTGGRGYSWVLRVFYNNYAW